MYRCIDCEHTFSDYKTIEEHHPYGMGYAAERWAACPNCESTDIEEVYECSRCGELVTELEEGLCDLCYGEMYGED